MMTTSTDRKFVIALFITFIVYLGVTVSLGRWLNPAPSDIRLSFEQTSPAQNSLLPQRALDNHMPQLGKIPFWIDGKLMEIFGRYSPYVSRYLLFLISVAMMYFLFIRYIRPAEESPGEWSLLFLMTLSGSFFFMIKFFFWLDYLVSIPLALGVVILMRKNAPSVAVFILTMIILYVKISAFFILLTFFGIFAGTELLRKYRIPLILASLVSVTGFFLRWGSEPFSDRGETFINEFASYFLMGLNLLMKPWRFFGFFDKSAQELITNLGPFLLVKLILFIAVTIWLLLRKNPGFKFRIICIILSFVSALVLLRDTPTLHDFAAYSGVVELGILSLFWIAYRELDTRYKIPSLIGFFFITSVQFFFWSADLAKLEATVPKLSLTREVIDHMDNGKKNLILFCAANVGEFEYFLEQGQIHYSLWDDAFPHTGNAILLVPERCQHEVISDSMRKKYAGILSKTGANYLKTVKIDRNQIYGIYEIR